MLSLFLEVLSSGYHHSKYLIVLCPTITAVLADCYNGDTASCNFQVLLPTLGIPILLVPPELMEHVNQPRVSSKYYHIGHQMALALISENKCKLSRQPQPSNRVNYNFILEEFLTIVPVLMSSIMLSLLQDLTLHSAGNLKILGVQLGAKVDMDGSVLMKLKIVEYVKCLLFPSAEVSLELIFVFLFLIFYLLLNNKLIYILRAKKNIKI